MPEETTVTPSGPTQGAGAYTGEDPPEGAQIYYSLKDKPTYLRLEIANVAGQTVRELPVDSSPGLHSVSWDLRAAQRTLSAMGVNGRHWAAIW